MKIQIQILVFIACLNLATGLVFVLQLPGAGDVLGQNPSNATEYGSHWNATEVAEGWGATPFSGIPVIGDIFSGLSFLWRVLPYLIDGFPQFITWLGDTYIRDKATQLVFNIIANVIRAIFAIMMGLFVVEFISGRIMTE